MNWLHKRRDTFITQRGYLQALKGRNITAMAVRPSFPEPRRREGQDAVCYLYHKGSQKNKRRPGMSNALTLKKPSYKLFHLLAFVYLSFDHSCMRNGV